MRRSRGASSPSPFRALAHHHAQHGQQMPESVSSVLRSFNVDTNPARPVRPSPLTASIIPDMPLDLLDRIRSFPLFMSAPDDFLAAIGKHLRPQIHAPHDHILTEGDDAKAMYWLVRGVVAVTSRDGEAVYAELKPGAFFGEIGVLMDMPRTATIVARTKCLLVVLKKEDLHTELPRYPDMEKAIRQEAQERLTILKKKQQERRYSKERLAQPPQPPQPPQPLQQQHSLQRHQQPYQHQQAGHEPTPAGTVVVVNTKKRKSPSPGVIEDPAVGGSALGSGYVNVRKTLKELPLFSTLPSDILHFLGLSAQPKSYSPFTDIIREGSHGNDIYFIVSGEVEVIHEATEAAVAAAAAADTNTSFLRPRLTQGQYFGEMASLGFSPGSVRTATVRSITGVECLIISGEALDELWRRCPPELKLKVEETARKRHNQNQADVEMKDVGDVGQSLGGQNAQDKHPLPPALRRLSVPHVTFTSPSKPSSPTTDEADTRQPTDPDPFLSVDMENMRNRRRNSLAPPNPQGDGASTTQTTCNAAPQISENSSPLKLFSFPPLTNGNGVDGKGHNSSAAPAIAPAAPLVAVPVVATEEDEVRSGRFKKARTLTHRPFADGNGEMVPASSTPPLQAVLEAVFQYLSIVELIRLRAVCTDWKRILTTSPQLCRHVDLSPFNRHVTDWSLSHVIAPFVGQRAVVIDISNCFHITDEGFQALWKNCGKNVRAWRMKSVWDVSASQILDMSENARDLEEIDWSNCRKVGDNLLARVVGWIVPGSADGGGVLGSNGQNQQTQQSRQTQQAQQAQQIQQTQPGQPGAGTVIGCGKLSVLDLSYCKHITDRSMLHLAAHAAGRLRSLTLTRCTSVTDAGFQAWAPYRFRQLTHLGLADCTYLSDNAVVSLVNAAKSLTHLDLSFCCALSDTATEVVALGLPLLQDLRLAFCGSAVSDASLRCVALHLQDLRGLSVRGCVRVTGAGVEHVLDGCTRLEWLDASQCKNLSKWIDGGGIARWGYDERNVCQQSPQPAWSRPGIWCSPTSSSGTAIASKNRTLGLGFTLGLSPVPRVPSMRGPRRRARKPVKFIVEKGAFGGLR